MDEVNFRKKLFGYSIRQVQSHIRSQKNRTEALLMEKQERLLALRDENLRLREQLEDCRRREADVSGALMEARAQARRILIKARDQAEQIQAESREALKDLEVQIGQRREALRQAARNMDLLAGEFGRAAAQQDRLLTLPEAGTGVREKGA